MRRLIFAACVSFTFSMSRADEPNSKFTFIDLQPKANQVLRETLSDNYPDSHLADLPQGEQRFGGAPFKIGPGCICLGSTFKTTKPDKVEIPVKLKLTKLFMLHATQFGGAEEPNPTNIKDGTLI